MGNGNDKEFPESLKLFPYLAGGLLHDAKNCIVGMRGYTMLLSHMWEAKDPKQEFAELSSEISACGERLERIYTTLSHIIRDYYAESKSGRPEEKVGEIVETFRKMHPKMTYKFEANGALDSSRLPLGAATFIAGELLENATTACRGAETASVSLEIKSMPKEQLLSIECLDTGPGFPTEEIGALVRGERLRSDKSGSAKGYGLYLMTEISRRLGGQMLISNREPKGARVQILLSTKGEFGV